MFNPAIHVAAETMISDFNPVTQDRRRYNAASIRHERVRTGTAKELEDSDIPFRVKGCALKSFRAHSEIVEWEEHLRRRRETVRVEAGKYLELRKKSDRSRQCLDFNPAAEERDRLRALFEQETASISGQREHIGRYVQFGEKYRKMTKEREEWPIGVSEEMRSMHERLEESESRAREVALRLAEAEVEAAEWADQLGRARKAANRGFWERVSAAIFGVRR